MKSKDTVEYLSQNNGKKLAYRHLEGDKTLPTLVFLGGYRSDMTGTKAAYLADFCADKGYALLRFDYSGHGASSGDFKDGCIGDWYHDALDIIQTVVKDDIILVGSSMGGWIGLLVAKAMGERVKGFIGIAAAPDFTHDVWHSEMNDAQRELCKQQSYINTPDGDTLTYKLLQEGEQHLIFDKPLNLPFPVILLQGKLDAIVPYKTAQKLAVHITSNVAPEIILIDDGDHRLARDEDLKTLEKTIDRILALII